MRTTRFTSWMSLLCVALLFGTSAAAQAQSADLGISKIGPGTAAAGSNVTYTLVMQNNGPDDAAAAQFDDAVPAGMTFVSAAQNTGPVFTCSTPSSGGTGTVTCSIATLPSGAAAMFTITTAIPAAAAPGSFFLNSATVSSQTPDPNSENDTGVAGTQVPAPQADVGVAKTGPASAAANSDVSYSISVSNFGPDAATNVSLADTLPGSMTFVSFTQDSGPAFNCGVPGTSTTCTIASLPAGSSATFTFVGHVPSGTPSGTTFTNVATVSSDSDPNSDNDSSTTSATVASADVGITKAGPASAIAGQNFDYVITLNNAGPDPATSASFSDTLPPGTTFFALTQNTGPGASCATPAVGTGGTVACGIGQLLNGQSAQFTLTVTVGSGVANGTVLSNTATASTSSVDANSGNDSSTVNTTVNSQTDVAVTKSGPATATAGTNASYTLSIANSGPSAASNVTLTDALPAGETFVSLTQTSGPTFTCTTGSTVTCSIASLISGNSASFTLTVSVAGSVANGTVLSNTAMASTSSVDANSGNDSSTVNTTVSSQADVTVTKSGPAAVTAGTNASYTLAVANSGPSTAGNVTLSDVLPAGETFVSLTQTSGPTFTCTTGSTVTCNIASLTSGNSASFTLTVNIAANVANGTMLSNTANVSSTTPDPAAANNSSTVSSTVQVTSADLALTKSGPASATAGSNVSYTLSLLNNGPSAASAVVLSDTLPAGETFVSLTQTTGPVFACTTPAPGAGGTITCTIASLATGASASFSLVAALPANASVGTMFTNTATATSSTADPGGANNSASSSVVLGVPAAVAPTPTLDTRILMLLALLIAAATWSFARRTGR